MKNKEIDKLIRDITRAGFMPKSEARRRINEIIKDERERIKKVIEGMTQTMKNLEGDFRVNWLNRITTSPKGWRKLGANYIIEDILKAIDL